MPKRIILRTLPNNYYYGIKECCLLSSTENENHYLLDDTKLAVTAKMKIITKCRNLL